MKKLSSLVVLIVAIGVFCISGCKKEPLSGPYGITSSTVVQLNETPENLTVSGLYNTDSDLMDIYFSNNEDELQQRFILRIRSLSSNELRYELEKPDEILLDIRMSVIVGGDAGCDVYSVDFTATTNFFEITQFDRSNCFLKGAYDFTFIRNERGGRGCQNPRFPEVVRLVSDGFEVTIGGC